MRVLAVLCVLTGVAHADPEAATDKPEPRWEFRDSGIVVTHPSTHGYAGFTFTLEHRVDDRLWVGLGTTYMIAREESADHMRLPLQHAYFGAATARYELGRTGLESDGGYLAGELRGELGAGVVRFEDTQSTPGIGSVAIGGRMGERRFAMVASMGFAFAFAGSHTGIDPWGIDVRIGGAIRW